MLLDLSELNQVAATADGTVPIRMWLGNADRLASTLVEGSVFRDALQRCEGGASSQQIGAGTAGAPRRP